MTASGAWPFLVGGVICQVNSPERGEAEANPSRRLTQFGASALMQELRLWFRSATQPGSVEA